MAVVILVLTVIVYFVLRGVQNKSAEQETARQAELEAEKEPPKPVYEATIADIRFLFESANNMGRVLTGTAYQPDLKTTEKFIQVVVGAQNKSKVSIDRYAWDLGPIVDSENRVFEPITNQAYYFLPKPDLCGAELKPEFRPIPCVRIYEVSRASTKLKIEVRATNPNTNKKEAALLDLDVR